MIRFENAQWLWLLLGLCIFAVFLWWTQRRRRKASHAFVAQRLSEQMAYAHSPKKIKWKQILWEIALAFLIVGLAKPQIGTRLEEVKREGIDIFIGLDVSTSMLCEDISPSRLESAKHEVLRFINGLKGDRVGLVAFAGTAVIHCPLTTDYGAAKLLVKVMSPDLLPEPGTALVDAIDAARRSFKREETKSKVLILVSDGEDHEEKAVQAAEDAAQEGIRIYTIGLGTPQGAPIPLYSPQGNRIGFKKNKSGEVIMTHLNEMLLRRVAEAANGQYMRGTQGAGELETIWTDISSMEKRELTAKKFTAFEDRFQYFILPAFLLLLMEFFISERRGLFWNSRQRVSRTEKKQERQAA